MSIEARQARVNQRIAILAEKIPEFGYQPIDDSVLTQASKWRPIRRVVYEGGTRGIILRSNLDILKDDDGSYVLALTPDNEVIFLLQVRAGLAIPFQIELPAGSVTEGGNARVNAIHELQDEVGAHGEIEPVLLGVGPVLSGRTPMETYFYLARNVRFDALKQKLDPGELIIPFTIPSDESLLFVTTLMHNRFQPGFPKIGVDPKIISALVLAAQHFSNQGEVELAQKLVIL